jgi:hypothetical protein
MIYVFLGLAVISIVLAVSQFGAYFKTLKR